MYYYARCIININQHNDHGVSLRRYYLYALIYLYKVLAMILLSSDTHNQIRW